MKCIKDLTRWYRFFTDLLLNIIIASLILSPLSANMVYAQDSTPVVAEKATPVTVQTVKVADDVWVRTGPKKWYRNTTDNVYDVTYEDEWSYVLAQGDDTVEFNLWTEVVIYADGERKPTSISTVAEAPPVPVVQAVPTVRAETIVQAEPIVFATATVVTPEPVPVIVSGVEVVTTDVTSEVLPSAKPVDPESPGAVTVVIPPNFEFSDTPYGRPPPVSNSQISQYVPGLYGTGDSASDLYKPFVESAFNSMRSNNWDLRGANNVSSFISILSNDKELRAEFIPFLLVAAYEGLISEQNSAANNAIRDEITKRSIAWQEWTAGDIEHQWTRFKNRTMGTMTNVAKPTSYQGNTMSVLLEVPSGCNTFEAEMPSIKIADDETGVDAINQVFGPYTAHSIVDVISQVQLDQQALEWHETEIGQLEMQLGIDFSSISSVKSVEQAFAKIGLGSAAVLPVVGAMTGLHVNTAFQRWRKTILDKEMLRANDIDDVLDRRIDQIISEKMQNWDEDFLKRVDGLADDASKEAANAAKGQARRKFELEITERVTREETERFASDGVDKALDVTFKKFLKTQSDDIIGELTEGTSKAVAKKVGAKLGKGLAASLAVFGVIWDAAEVITAVLPCKVWEKKVLGNIHKPVKPDFRHALVTAGEMHRGLVYPHCKEGYKGSFSSCVKQGCPFGYGESELFCTPKTIAKKSYGRGAGHHGDCGPDQVNEAGLCYDRCPAGYKGVGLACWSECPDGFTDTGALCTASGIVKKLDSYTRIGQESDMVCPSGWNHTAGFCQAPPAPGFDCNAFECWRSCPSGYSANLLENKCMRTGFWGWTKGRANLYDRQGRTVKALIGPLGVGTCPAGKEKKGEICYPECRAGYDSIALNCSKPCPEGYHNSGLTCTADTYTKDTIYRNMHLPLACSSSEYPDKDGLLCYPQYDDGFYGVGPVCWQSCPPHMTDTGALCTYQPEGGFKELVGFPKESYERGVGKIPKLVNYDYTGLSGIEELRGEFSHIGDTLKASTYTRVDNYGEAITADARREFRKEVFIHLARLFVSEPASSGRLILPPFERDF